LTATDEAEGRNQEEIDHERVDADGEPGSQGREDRLRNGGPPYAQPLGGEPAGSP
jgi:hypothetical protein